jgi:hypothetical protein
MPAAAPSLPGQHTRTNYQILAEMLFARFLEYAVASVCERSGQESRLEPGKFVR